MSKQRCEKLATKLGGIIHDGDDLRLEAPVNKTVDGDVHEIVYDYRDGEKGLAWAAMLANLKEADSWSGFPDCQEAKSDDCEWCAGFDEAAILEANKSAAEHMANVLKRAWEAAS
jgi:hypothetical protein